MLCKIAELTVEVPEAGEMLPRCREYLSEAEVGADIVIRADLYNASKYPPYVTEKTVAYMESGFQFYRELRKFDGMMLHASAVEMEGRGYLFSAPCGTGKSTHTRLWQQVFGAAAQVFNDDKPALRQLDGRWFAYGTPWCGKDGINQNKKVPLGGICFIKRGQENKIRRLDSKEAVQKLVWQTMHRFREVEQLDLTMGLIERIVRVIPVYELECLPEPEAARLSYETMRCGAEEAGL